MGKVENTHMLSKHVPTPKDGGKGTTPSLPGVAEYLSPPQISDFLLQGILKLGGATEPTPSSLH
jgi:hypothetical protein